MISISACRLYWLIYVGRVESTIQADKLFEEHEWKSAYVYFREKIPDNPPPISEMIIKIAKMGGYKDKKGTNPPGIKLMWLGLQVFTTAATMYKNILSMKRLLERINRGTSATRRSNMSTAPRLRMHYAFHALDF